MGPESGENRTAHLSIYGVDGVFNKYQKPTFQSTAEEYFRLPVKRHMKFANYLLILLIFATKISCSTSVLASQAVPTFEDINSAELSPYELSARLQFSDETTHKIIHSKSNDDLLAAAIQSIENSEKVFSSLMELGPEKAVDYISVLNFCLGQDNNERGGTSFCDNGKILETIHKKDPANAFIYFISAAYALENKEIKKATELLAIGNNLDDYNSYSTTRFLSVSKTDVVQ